MSAAVEKPCQAEGEQKRVAVRNLFADIAPSYDLLNTLMSFGLHHLWRRDAVRKLDLHPGDSVLDICCGTGDFLLPLRNAVGDKGHVEGLDFCSPMLAIAEKKVKGRARLTLGDATHLPHASGLFDAATVGWGLRNVPDLGAALREANRVLKPGGKFICLDMTQSDKGIGRKAFEAIVPILGKLFGKTDAYAYLPKSTEKFTDKIGLAQAMRDAGFEKVDYKSLFFGNIAMHWGVKP